MTAGQDRSASEQVEEFDDALAPGATLLHGQYTIERFLNSGGFGNTYLAKDSLDRIVVVKECFPSALCCRTRNGVRARSQAHQKEFQSVVKHFGQEARRLAKLQHPHIVGVHQVFEDSGTAYMALDFVEGQDLLDIIDKDPERLGPAEIREILRKCLDAISYVHKHDILHRDIAPDNILVDADGNPTLIDFGAAREVASRASRVLSELHVVKDGYSPQEFYLTGSPQSKSSDLYSLAATFYHLITGVAPPNSQARLAALVTKEQDPYEPIPPRTEGYDSYFLEALDKALRVFPKDRLQTAEDWIAEIDADERRRALLARAQRDNQIEMSIRKLAMETNEEIMALQASSDASAGRNGRPKRPVVRPRPAVRSERRAPSERRRPQPGDAEAQATAASGRSRPASAAAASEINAMNAIRRPRRRSLFWQILTAPFLLFARRQPQHVDSSGRADR